MASNSAPFYRAAGPSVSPVQDPATTQPRGAPKSQSRSRWHEEVGATRPRQETEGRATPAVALVDADHAAQAVEGAEHVAAVARVAVSNAGVYGGELRLSLGWQYSNANVSINATVSRSISRRDR